MAPEMVQVLAASVLYAHTGGSPPSLPELTARYERQVGGSGDADEAWLNWVLRGDHGALGYVQATVRRTGEVLTAVVAWVVRPEAQGRGVAKLSAGAMIEHLRVHGVHEVAASIAHANTASVSVARRLGLTRTGLSQDGEQVWALALTPPR